MGEQRLIGLALLLIHLERSIDKYSISNEFATVLINMILFFSLTIFVLQSKSLGKIVPFAPSPSEALETQLTLKKLV